MEIVLVILLLLLLGGGGYGYRSNRFVGPVGIAGGGVLGLVILIVALMLIFGGR